MPVVAITGNIACGKSLTLKEFKKLGAYTIDCDAIVGNLYKKERIKKKLKEEFGTYKKGELAQLVFRDNSYRKKLEAILHPEVIKELKKQLKHAGKKHRCIFVEVPLLFEASLVSMFDYIVVVRARREQQLERLVKLGFTREEAIARINAQMPLSKKLKKADFIINNISGPEEVKGQALKVFEKLRCAYGK